MERTIVVAVLTMGVLAGLGRGVGSTSRVGEPRSATAAPSVPALADAAPSEDALIARFLDALARKDRDALHKLRVDENEYVNVIYVGNVEPGQPLRTLNRPDVIDWAWASLHQKSTYYEAYLIDSFGGHDWHVIERTYRKGTKQYATYKAYKQLDLLVADDDGRQSEIRTGSIAEVDGAFKFVSYIRD